MPQPPGWKRLAAGVYLDAAGAAHLVVSEMLEAHGFADTPENRQTLIDAVHEIFPLHGIPTSDAGDVVQSPARKEH